MGARRRVGVLVALAAVGAGAGWYLIHRPAAVVASCTATVGGLSYALDPEQAANATTIAAEAARLGLPAHAVSVGLAAALQESKLRNLSYGDRDSLGLFQQRPSQGWGTPAQLQDPRYAARAFFRGLARVRGWERMPIYLAAQRVQRSAAPRAYADWDTTSRTVAQTLTGEVPAGFSCRYPSVHRAGPGTDQALRTAVGAALGPGALGVATTPAREWLVASWLVSRAPQYALARVDVDGWTWTPHATDWRHDARSRGPGVSYVLRPAS